MPSTVESSMGPLSTKLSPSKGSGAKSEGSEEGVYYAVYIPTELLGAYENEFSECDRVFDNKEEALLFIKKNKKIRFKSFRNFQDAQNFAYNGHAGASTDGGNAMGNESLLCSPSSLAVEKPSPFKSLKSQELVKLRKLIEKGNLAEVKKLVWENPRYLVSSGDFPTILHEGCRYNALHVSTKALNAPMTDLLLETIGDPAFTTLLYDGPPSTHTYIERSDILLDLYLNTPDKALNETPLHFASKFGSVECVRRLIACSKTQLNARNKDGKTPLDVVCLRCSGASDQLKVTIRTLLSEDQYYVPVWRSSDACDAPLVGPPCKTSDTPEKLSIRRDQSDVTSPILEIKAFAGPMNESAARAFRTKWKREMKAGDPGSSPVMTTPTKYNASLNSSLNGSFQSPPTSVEKSFEIVGRRLALDQKVEWRERWPFLNKCVDLQSTTGLELLENYLHNKLLETLSAQKLTDDLANGNVDSIGGAAGENENVSLQARGGEVSSDCMISPIEKLCLNFDTLSLSSHSNQSEGSTASAGSGSNISSMLHLLIEKSCEVFAKRLLQGLKNASFERNRGSLVRILRQEAKHLNNLVASFTQDARFKAVSLNRIHSIIAMCLGSLLITECQPESVDWILRTFNEIGKGKLLTRSSLLSGDSPNNKSLDKDEDNASVLCLISQLLTVLGFNTSDGTIAEENSDATQSSCGDENIIRGKLLQGPSKRASQGNRHTNEDGSYNTSKQSGGQSYSASLFKSHEESNNNHEQMQSESCDDNKASQRNGQNDAGHSQHTANGPDRSLNTSVPKSLSLQEGMSKSAPKDLRPSLSHENISKKTSHSFSIENLLIRSGPNFLYASSGSEKEAERNWNLSQPCQCTTKPALPRNLFSNIRSYSRFNSYRSAGANVSSTSQGKRIEFDLMDEGQGGGSSPPGLDGPMRMRTSRGGLNESPSSSMDRSIAETNYHLSSLSSSSDSSDTDDEEYYTPPGSFVEEHVHASSSSEEEMLDAMEEDVEIFLIGNFLSATDVDVLQTLAQCESILDPAKYPNIYKWRHLALLKLNQDTLPRPPDSVASPLRNRFYSPSARFITSPPASRALGKYATPSPRQLFPPPSGSLSTGGPCSPLSRPAPSSYKPLQHSTPSDFLVEKT